MSMSTIPEQLSTTSPLSTALVHAHKTRSAVEQFLGRIIAAMRQHYEDERGMSTIEYALGCVAAAALGALLYTVVTSDTVEQALSGIFERALNEG